MKNSQKTFKPAKRKLTAMQRKQERTAYLFILPAVLMFLFFVVVPIVVAIYLSMNKFSYKNLERMQWVGFGNYAKLFGDELAMAEFRKSFIHALYYTALYVPGAVVLSLLFAVLVNQKIKGAKAYRVMYYLPSVTNGVAAATVFSFIFNAAGYGLLNQMFNGGNVFYWTSTPGIAMAVIAIVNIWGGVGGNMIIYLAALQGVSPDMIEAAKVDGASKWQIFYHITLPSIAQATFFVVMMALIGSFQLYDQVDIITGGGGETSTPVFNIYKYIYEPNTAGLANAMAMVLFVVIIIITSINNYVQNKINERFD